MSELLQTRVKTSRLLGANESLVLHGGGNTSVKEDGILWVKGSGWDLATIEKEGFAPVKLDALLKIADMESISDTELVRLQKEATIDKNAPAPSIEAVVHAIIPYTFVDHTHADAIVTLSNTPNGKELIQSVYGEKVVIVDYVMPGFILAKEMQKTLSGKNWDEIEGIILLNHGVFSFDEDGEKCCQKMLDLVKKADDFLADNAYINDKTEPCGIGCAGKEALKAAISEARGAQTAIYTVDTLAAKELSALDDIEEILSGGSLTPEHVIRIKPRGAIVEEGFEARDIASYAKWYKEYFERNNDGSKIMLDPAPRWGVVKNKGVFVAAKDEKEAKIALDIVRHTAEAMLRAKKLGGWQSLSEPRMFDIEYWELEQAKLKK